MPTYDYRCEECGYEFETFHGMLAEPLVNCPECHKPKLIKLISMGACVIIKNTKTPCHGGRSKKPRNLRSGDKLGEGANKAKGTPWWRKGRPLNKTVLNNPGEYIRTGKTTKSRQERTKR